MHELHSKDANQIYNLFPNLVQRLSEFDHLEKGQFDAIVKQLVDYVTKEKQKELILEKMLMRLRDGKPREWRTIAGVLPHMKYTDKMLLKIIDMYELWKERMLDSNNEVRDALYSVVQNVRKAQVGTSLKDMKPKLDQIQ